MILKKRHGQYCKKSNTQRIKTPNVIFSIGDGQVFKRQKRTKEKGSVWNIDTVLSLFLMHLKDGSITIVNPLDEPPTKLPFGIFDTRY